MTGYFRNFNVESFTFDGSTYSLEDLTRRVVFEAGEFDNGVMVEELLLTGERPDQLAHMIYGDSNLWWIVFIINNITANDWPLSDDELQIEMEKKYTRWELEQTYGHFNPHRVPSVGWSYFEADGKKIDYSFNKDEFNNPNPNFRISNSNGERRTLRQQLETINEQKRRVKVLRKQFVRDFLNDFQKRIRADVDYGLI